MVEDKGSYRSFNQEKEKRKKEISENLGIEDIDYSGGSLALWESRHNLNLRVCTGFLEETKPRGRVVQRTAVM